MIRRGGRGDLELVFSIQREASLAGFAHIFPPDRYPFPDEAVRSALRKHLEDPANAVLIDHKGRGFAVAGRHQLHRLFVCEGAWGTGVADELHSAAVEALRAAGARSASLWCLAANARARRFYEKRGWRLDGRTVTAPYPPHPVQLGHEIDVRRPGAAGPGAPSPG